MLLFPRFCYLAKGKSFLCLSLMTDVVSRPEDKRLHLSGLPDCGRAFESASSSRPCGHRVVLLHEGGFIESDSESPNVGDK